MWMIRMKLCFIFGFFVVVVVNVVRHSIDMCRLCVCGMVDVEKWYIQFPVYQFRILN